MARGVIAFAVSGASINASFAFGIGLGELLDDPFQRFGLRAFRRLHFGEHQREQMRRFLEFQFDRLAAFSFFCM